jgi:hypothetical protein
MAAARKHDALVLGGAAAAALAAYNFLYKPWKAGQAAAGIPGLPPLASFLSTPGTVGPSAPPAGGPQGSIVDARISPGGDVGYAMWKKNWTQQQATARLDALKTAYRAALAQISALRAQTTNPALASANIGAATLAAQQNDAAAADALARSAAALAAGDQAGAATWAAAAAAHQQDAREIRSRVTAVNTAPDNTAAIAAYEGAAAGHKADYFALTGMTLA